VQMGDTQKSSATAEPSVEMLANLPVAASGATKDTMSAIRDRNGVPRIVITRG